MTTPKTCPQCGVPLPAEALQGLCPACLLQQGGLADSESGPEQKSFEPPPVAELAKLFPQLEILEFIGRGGMGAVYKARQRALDRFVALKVLPAASGGGSAFGERFNREARALARLSHPNIVAVYDYGQAGGLPFFIMEYVDGLNLRALERSGRIAPREALRIIPQICDALQYAHDEGVVHRDIKPENVLLDRKGQVRIADFGLAKILRRQAEELRLTEEGQVMGTPHYMAPEQVETPLHVDHRADIYALGVVLYEMLTGELPLGRFPPPSKRVTVDVRFDQVVLRALEKQPERRYQHASDVKSDVETIRHTPPPASSADAAPGEPVRDPGVRGPITPSGTLMLSSPHLSRNAVVGACWAVLFFVATTLSLVAWDVHVVETGEGSPPPPSVEWWRYVLIFTVLVPGLTAPFGTTILGWLSVAQIRRSGGRLYGLGLAVFDGLLFPMLILDGLIFWAWNSVVRILASLFGTGPHADPWPALVILGGLLLCAVVDFFICRKVWRAVREPGPDRGQLRQCR